MHSEDSNLQVTEERRIRMMMKRTFLVMAGTACLALLPVYALGQRDSSTTPAGGPETTTTPANKATSANQSRDNDIHDKSKSKQKKSAAKRTPSKEPTENERIFDEMLRSAMSGGL
jgi:hypothetical protein